MLGYTPPGSRPPQEADPPGADTPPSPGKQMPPGSRPPPHPLPPGADTPSWSRHPPGSRPPLGADPPPPRSRLQHTVNERPVRILLECILVVTLHSKLWYEVLLKAENCILYLLKSTLHFGLE